MIAEQLTLNPRAVTVPDDLTLTLRWALLLPLRACAVAALLVEAAQAEGKWVVRSVDQLTVAAKAHQAKTLCPGLVSEPSSLDATVLSGALILKQRGLAVMRGDDICLTAEFVRLYGA